MEATIEKTVERTRREEGPSCAGTCDATRMWRTWQRTVSVKQRRTASNHESRPPSVQDSRALLPSTVSLDASLEEQAALLLAAEPGGASGAAAADILAAQAKA